MATRSVNKVILIGNLGKDAETKFTPSGMANTKFSIATVRRWKDKSGEWKEETDWVNVVMWGNEALGQYLKKGKQIYAEGRIQTRSYEAKDGTKRYSTEVVADNVILLGGTEGQAEPRPVPKQQSLIPEAAKAQPTPYDEDDVPF